MDTKHPDLIQPENVDSIVWRYLTDYKIFVVLQESALRFSRLDSLGDNFEGSLTKGQAKQAKAIHNVIGWSGRNYDGSAPEIFRKRVFVSCWQMENHESFSMWKLYVPKNGLVLQTTYKKLSQSMENDNIRIGCVDYIDFNDDSFTEFKGLSVTMTKRMEFRHEQEVRILALIEKSDDNEYPKHIYLPWKIKDSIDRIIISPEADESFKLEVEKKLYELGINDIPVSWSSLKQEPYY